MNLRELLKDDPSVTFADYSVDPESGIKVEQFKSATGGGAIVSGGGVGGGGSRPLDPGARAFMNGTVSCGNSVVSNKASCDITLNDKEVLLYIIKNNKLDETSLQTLRRMAEMMEKEEKE